MSDQAFNQIAHALPDIIIGQAAHLGAEIIESVLRIPGLGIDRDHGWMRSDKFQ